MARISNICVPRQVVCTICTSILRLSGKHFHFETPANRYACYLPINIQFMALHFDYLYNFLSRQWWLHVITKLDLIITTKLWACVIIFWWWKSVSVQETLKQNGSWSSVKWSVTDFEGFGHKKLYSSAEVSVTAGYCYPSYHSNIWVLFYVHMESVALDLLNEWWLTVRCYRRSTSTGQQVHMVGAVG